MGVTKLGGAKFGGAKFGGAKLGGENSEGSACIPISHTTDLEAKVGGESTCFLKNPILVLSPPNLALPSLFLFVLSFVKKIGLRCEVGSKW